MAFNQDVINFKVHELSKIKHQLDESIYIDIRPFSFTSVQKKPISEIKFSEVYIKGVAEKAFDRLIFDIPEMAKTSADFKKLFIEAFFSASSSKMSNFGDYNFYPNFSNLAYQLKIKSTVWPVMRGLNLNPIDKMVCQMISGDIIEIINQKCILKFGEDYAEKCSKAFAKEHPHLSKEIDLDFRTKNKKVS